MHPYVKAARLKQKLPGYAIARAHGLNHQTLQYVTGHHREKFLKSFRYVQANVVTGVTVAQGIVSCKHDGIAAYFFWEKGQEPITFHMPSCGVEVGLPCANELAQALVAQGRQNALVAGELIVSGDRSHSYDVIRTLFSPQSQADLDKLHLALFDVLILDQQETQSLDYPGRVKLLDGLPKTAKARPVRFQTVTSLAEVNAFLKEEVRSGQEGIVLHETSTKSTYKIKPKFNIDLAIVGYVVGTEELTGHAVSIMGALVHGNSIQLVARVGVADPALREPLLGELSKHRIPCNYTETDSESRPIAWVKPTKVMEINAEDIHWEDIRGQENINTVLKLEGDRYVYQGQGFIFRPFHPTLERLREDKPVAECTFAQLPGVEFKLKQLANGKPATVFLREVYAKTIKGNPAVKKAVAWEQEREGFPRFVIHTVDFSAGRAEPLKEDTLATDERAEADRLIEDWRKDEISKGWSKA